MSAAIVIQPKTSEPVVIQPKTSEPGVIQPGTSEPVVIQCESQNDEAQNHDNKLCKGCNKTLPLTDYYKAGFYYQSLCKPCHNASRKNYKTNERPKKEITKKKVDFFKYPIEKQEAIIKMINDNARCVDICETHKINYQTFKKWRRQKHLPQHPTN